jgi:hypothetical protein
LPADLRWPPFDVAIDHEDASFALVAQAHFDFLDADGTNPQKQRQGAYYFPQLLSAFYRRHGHIEQYILCNHTQAAAALTDRDEIWFKLPRENHDHHEFCKLMMHCYMVYAEARRTLANDRVERGMCVSVLFTVFSYLVNAVDLEEQGLADPSRIGRRNRGSVPKSPLLKMAEDMLHHAETYYRRVAQQLAKRRYLLGVVFGTLILGLVIVLLVVGWGLDWTDALPDLPDAHTSALLVSIAAGGIGAAVSVMTRMTSGKLSLDYRAPRWLLLSLGAFRVAIGATFGIVLFLLLQGNILPIPDPEPNTEEWIFFFAALAFLAGFSERLAQDMLTVSESSFTGTSPEPQPIS